MIQTPGRSLDAKAPASPPASITPVDPSSTPDEVRTLPANAELLFLAGQRSIVARKLADYADPKFRRLVA